MCDFKCEFIHCKYYLQFISIPVQTVKLPGVKPEICMCDVLRYIKMDLVWKPNLFYIIEITQMNSRKFYSTEYCQYLL